MGRRYVRARGFIVLAVGLFLASPVWLIADTLEQFKQTKPDLLPMLRSKEPQDRIEAVRRLKAFPVEDSVKLIHACLDDHDPGVSKEAIAALREMNDNHEVCETLLAAAKRSLHGRKRQGAATDISILLASKLQSTHRAVDELLADAAAGKNGPAVVVDLLDEIAARRSTEDLNALDHLAKTQLFENHFGVRRTIVYALTVIPSKEAVGVLVGMLDRVGGDARADAVEYLMHVTGQDLGFDSKRWQQWWKENQESFAYPPVSTRAAYRGTLTEGESGSYYEMPIFAERMVFVLDISGSMGGQRIQAAKRELLVAIASLRESCQFGIVVFNDRASAWQRQLVPADDRNKQAAKTFVDSLGIGGSTASYSALDLAFTFDTEAVYFLSDGAPTTGNLIAPVDIVAAVTATNKVRRISLYTIGVGAGFPGSPLDTFLKSLAEQNLGTYRRVDQ
jgi:hypothetical protein